MSQSDAVDPSLDLQNLAHSFTPTIITAPTARNGITLIQRLLNSTRQAMIFGENRQFVQTLPTLTITNYVNHQQGHAELEASRQKFLNETTEYWSSNLWPDSGRYMMLTFEMFYKAAMIYRQTAQECGFKHWGIKNPMTDRKMVHNLGQLMRTARFVVIYRNPFDVVASAKARQFITDQQQVTQYARQWQDNLQAVRDHPPNHLMLIQHEQLTAEPEPILQELESFTGLTGIDRSVLGRKINTFAAPEGAGHAPDGYIAPESLTEQEVTVIEQEAGQLMQWAGYATPTAS
jgi:hypothetical protein